MEELNKKTLLRIFLGFIFVQASVLLAISANFLLAQTNDTATTTNPNIEITVSDSGNRKDFQATSNVPLESVTFYFDNLSDPAATSIQMPGTPLTTDLTDWTLNLSDSYLMNEVSYNFYAIGFYEGISYMSMNNILIPADDESATIEITVRTENNKTVLQGTKYFYADTNYSLNNLTFCFDDLSTTAIDDYSFGSGVSPDLNSWSALIDTNNMPDSEYKFYAEGLYESIAYDSQNYIYVTIENNSSISNTTNPNIEITVSDSGNRKDFQATSDVPLESVTFYFDNLNDSASSVQFPGILTDTTNLTSWSLNLADGYLINGIDYNFYVIGSYGENSHTSINDILIPANSDSETITPDTPDDNTTAEPLILTFIERFESLLFGDQRISISLNQEIFSCIFKIYGPKYAEFPAIKDSPTNYHFILQTKDFPNGYYTIKAVAENNIEIADIKLNIRIENLEEPSATETQPTTEVYPVTETQPADEIYPAIKTDPATYDSSVYPETFIFELPLECKERNLLTTEECQKYMSIPFECREKNILDPEECKRFMMENFMPSECKEAGITTKEECDYLLRNTYANFESFSTIEITPPYTAQIEEEITDECKKQGITSFEECKKHMMLINMPEECRQAGATNPDECEKIMFKEHGPQECIQAQIFNPEECEKYMFKKYAPDDCREAGILNPEACKKYMFEKYGEKENISPEKFPIECQKANVKTIEECEKIMKNIYLPQECADEGLENEQECEIYLQQKHMPKECRDAKAKSREECDKIMFKKFGPPECQKAGIGNKNKCEEFMLNKYAQKVKCDNIEDWQCKNFIEERHIGNIVAKQIKYNKIIEKKDEIVGKSMKAEYLEAKIIQEEKIVPIIRKDLGIKIIATNESIVLDEKDNLIQTAPIAFMIDSDEDGLPDDMEKRLGTDPSNADTDEDGHSDGEEIKNGYNPLGKGNLEKKLSPIEKAMMENKSLGHPVTEGEEVENFFVKNISNTEDAQGNLIEGYVLSGKTKPNSVATLYIYSDLPVVVTVDADQYGNWRYQFDQSLIEGEHEVYIAINDDTGKVIEKSKPLNFFIKEAKAVSVKDFVSITKASSEEPKESEVSIYNYLFITLFMAIAGILLFLTIIINRKKNRSL